MSRSYSFSGFSVLRFFSFGILIIGFIFLVVFIVLCISQNKKTRTCIHRVPGEILWTGRRNIVYRPVGERDFNQYPLVRYVVNGVVYEHIWNYGQTKAFPKNVWVWCNPDNPDEFYLEGFSAPAVIKWAMFAAFIGCLFIGFILLFVSFSF